MPATPTPTLVFRDRNDNAAAAADGPVIGVVPADRVSVVAVELPDLRGPRLEQALRWAAEDALAGDAESQHVVPLGRRDDGRMTCAVASKGDMDRWRAGDPALIALVPDAAAVPWEDGQLVLVDTGEAVLARWGKHAFDRLDPDLIDILLPDVIDQAAPKQVLWFGANAPDSVAELSPQHYPAPADLGAWLSAGAKRADVNLLYGDYAPAGQARPPRWGWTAALLALATVLFLAETALETAQLDQRARSLAEEIDSRSARLFPDLRLVPGREQLQIERALAERGTGSDRFVRTVRRASPLFADLAAIRVESLIWDGERLDLEVRAPSLPDLEALQDQMIARGLDVRLDEVAIETEGVRTRLRLQEAP